jgi:hypothetical protein
VQSIQVTAQARKVLVANGDREITLANPGCSLLLPARVEERPMSWQVTRPRGLVRQGLNESGSPAEPRSVQNGQQNSPIALGVSRLPLRVIRG